ncbi:MAG TPA: hypothetical protein VG326_20605 [Tepidisphaeraceae bacterium]|jgi:hypothetical protein|nr:hypothetical protein [Tepidisphaeraceae bacterium]
MKILAIFVLMAGMAACAQGADANGAALTAAGARVGKIKEGGMRVDIPGPKLTEDVWKVLESLPDLKAFSSSGKEFDDAALARLAKIATIETLFFNGPAITDKGLAALANFPNLHKFGIDHGQITGSGLSALAASKNLKAISFGGCLFNDQGMNALGAMTQLHEVSIRHDRNTSTGFADFGKLTELEKLQINPNFSPYYVGADFVHLSALSKLQELAIAQMIIPYDDGLSHLKSLRQLKKLKLELCGISPEDLAKIKSDLPDTVIDFTPAPADAVKKWNDALARRKAAK